MSWSKGCGNPVFPDVMGRVTDVLDWVEAIIKYGTTHFASPSSTVEKVNVVWSKTNIIFQVIFG